MNYGHGASKFNNGKNLVLPLGEAKKSFSNKQS